MRTLGWFGGVLVRKDDIEFEKTALPKSFVLARYTTLPFLEIKSTVDAFGGSSEEAERMVSAPLLPSVFVSFRLSQEMAVPTVPQ